MKDNKSYIKMTIEEELEELLDNPNNNPVIVREFFLPSTPIDKIKLLQDIIPTNKNVCMYYLEKQNIENPSVKQFNRYSDRGCIGCNGYNTECKDYLSYKTLHEVMNQIKYVKTKI